ncbi:hypothetical protein Ddye_020906 [Dipteronia dyeriana]|uniref:Uncharacterized protein n=1 Tax=Dipteronia dyeriana TaxID=168575 RepID=A0AAD9U1F9_9ROSI|nr:hypothetical protein Ddye_020906 [Dipteronia dyeriana]
MASHGSININSNSPKDGKNEGSPRGGGQCLCSPTTHQGSFRCRFHRTASSSSSPWIMKRSKSMPTNQNSVASNFSPKSVESST